MRFWFSRLFLATVLQVSGLIVGVVSMGAVSWPAAGGVLSVGLLLFGLAVERGR